jgi:hypothetical protein
MPSSSRALVEFFKQEKADGSSCSPHPPNLPAFYRYRCKTASLRH